MDDQTELSLSEDQVLIERTSKFPISFEIAGGDSDDDGSGETDNQTSDKM